MIAAAAFAASFFPSPYARSEFWTSSPSFFLLRIGVLTALIGLAYAWERRPWDGGRFSPLQQLGRTSLFIYWIHVEMIYGLVVRPLHKSMSFPAARSVHRRLFRLHARLLDREGTPRASIQAQIAISYQLSAIEPRARRRHAPARTAARSRARTRRAHTLVF